MTFFNYHFESNPTVNAYAGKIYLSVCSYDSVYNDYYCKGVVSNLSFEIILIINLFYILSHIIYCIVKTYV